MQISDSHIGFSNAPNTDVPGTLREAVDLVAKQKGDAELMIHTGDVSQLSRAAQFDTAEQIIKRRGPRDALRPRRARRVWRTTVSRSSSGSPRADPRATTPSTRKACTSSA